MNLHKSIYLEYASILFLVFSVFYFSNQCYKKYQHSELQHHQNYSNLIIFDVYEMILTKYNAKIVNISVIDGAVQACVEKDGFEFDLFVTNEEFLIEQFDDQYLITFKLSNKTKFLKKKSSVITKNNFSNIKIGSFCFINENKWFIFIDGMKFDQDNKIISDSTNIKYVSENKIIISINDVDKEFLI